MKQPIGLGVPRNRHGGLDPGGRDPGEKNAHPFGKAAAGVRRQHSRGSDRIEGGKICAGEGGRDRQPLVHTLTLGVRGT